MSEPKKYFWPFFWTIFVIIFLIVTILVPYFIFKVIKGQDISTITNSEIISEIATKNIPKIITKDMNDVNGILLGHTIWEGNVTITGDVIVPPMSTLEIVPGTIITFTSNKDNNPSQFDSEIKADGFNDIDPSRLKEYADSHSSIFVAGNFIAKGTQEKPILFTSDAKNKHYADWGAINIVNGDAIVEYIIIEYSRNGIAVSIPNENIIVRNSIIRHALWGCFSIKNSKGLYENNLADDCGHEGFDVGNDARLYNNKVTDSHSALVLLGGSPIIKNNTFQSEIHEFDGATPILENNIVDLSLGCNLSKTWDYLNFRIPCQGEPYLVD